MGTKPETTMSKLDRSIARAKQKIKPKTGAKKAAQGEKKHLPLLDKTSDTGTKVVMSTDTTKGQRENPIANMLAFMATGEIPKNEHLDYTLSKTKEILEKERLSNPNLDTRGRLLAKDFEKWMDVMERLIQEKNHDEVIQAFLRDSTLAMQSEAQVGIVKKGELVQMYQGLKDMCYLLVRSGEVRTLCKDFLDLFNGILGKRVAWVPEDKLPKRDLSVTEVIIIPVQGSNKEFDVTINPGYSGTEREYYSEPEQELPLESKKKSYTQGGYLQSEPRSKEWKDTYKPEHRAVFWNFIPVSADKLYNVSPEDSYLVSKYVDILERFGSKPEYANFVANMWMFCDLVQYQLESREKEVQEAKVDRSHALSGLKQATIFLERFAGTKEMADFKRVSQNLWTDIKTNTELTTLFGNFRSFTSEAVKDPEGLHKEINMKLAEDIIARAILLTRNERYKRRFYDLYDISAAMLQNVQTDPVVLDMQSKSSKLAKDFALNPLGSPDLFVIRNSIGQLRYLLVPVIKQYLQNIPIDKIDIFSPKFDVSIEDLVVSGTDIFPDFFDMKLNNSMHLDMQDMGLGNTKHVLKVKMSHIVPSFERVKFRYQKKTFPKISDHGIADFALRRNGATIKLQWLIENMAGQFPQVTTNKVKCLIDDIYINIIGSETKHGFMDKLGLRMMKGTLKKRMQTAIEKSLYDNMQSINDKINLFLSKRRGTAGVVSSANALMDKGWTAGKKRIKKGRAAQRRYVEKESVKPKVIEPQGPVSQPTIEQPVAKAVEQPATKMLEQPMLKSSEHVKFEVVDIPAEGFSQELPTVHA